MGSTNSCRQTDLGPRRVGIHFRKLACRSDARDEALPCVVFRASSLAHDRQALLMKATLATLAVSEPSSRLGRVVRCRHRSPRAATLHFEAACSQQAWRTKQGRSRLAAQQRDEADKALGGTPSRPEVPPRAPAVSAAGRTALQLIPGVRPT